MNKFKKLFYRRGFELIEDLNGELPVKSTVHSAGVDFIASQDIVIPAFRFKGEATLVPTGLKAFMPKNECLLIFARSSLPVNRGLVMSNGVGVVDSDYYNNQKNEGYTHYKAFPLPYENIKNTNDFIIILDSILKFSNTDKNDNLSIQIQRNLI